jgi:hypothetical protein
MSHEEQKIKTADKELPLYPRTLVIGVCTKAEM